MFGLTVVVPYPSQLIDSQMQGRLRVMTTFNCCNYSGVLLQKKNAKIYTEHPLMTGAKIPLNCLRKQYNLQGAAEACGGNGDSHHVI